MGHAFGQSAAADWWAVDVHLAEFDQAIDDVGPTWTHSDGFVRHSTIQRFPSRWLPSPWRIVVAAAVAGRPVAAADGHVQGQPTSNLHGDLQPIVVSIAVDLDDVDPWPSVDDFCHQKWQIVG